MKPLDRAVLRRYFRSKQEEMVEDILSLIRIESTLRPPQPGMPFGSGVAACTAAAEDILRRCGFVPKNHENYAVTAEIGEGPLRLDILGHLDVVPGGTGWTVTEPFRPKVLDGKIFGRGASDDKGPCICALYALRAVRELGLPLKGRVRLILGTDEESGSRDIAFLFAQEAHAPMTFSPDASFPLVNVEKGGLRSGFRDPVVSSNALPRILSIHGGETLNVVPALAEAVIEGMEPEVLDAMVQQCTKQLRVRFTCENQGRNRVKVTAHGRTTHASFPEGGENAVTALLQLLAILPLSESDLRDKVRAAARLFPHGDWHGRALGIAMQDPVSDATTLSLDILSYEDGVFAGRFDCRTSLNANESNTTAVLRRVMGEAGLHATEETMYAAHHVLADSELVQNLLAAYRDVTGDWNSQPIAMGGGTYVHNIENGVAFGCADYGRDYFAHGANEFFVIEEMLRNCEIFALAIWNLCGEQAKN